MQTFEFRPTGDGKRVEVLIDGEPDGHDDYIREPGDLSGLWADGYADRETALATLFPVTGPGGYEMVYYAENCGVMCAVCARDFAVLNGEMPTADCYINFDRPEYGEYCECGAVIVPPYCGDCGDDQPQDAGAEDDEWYRNASGDRLRCPGCIAKYRLNALTHNQRGGQPARWEKQAHYRPARHTSSGIGYYYVAEYNPRDVEETVFVSGSGYVKTGRVNHYEWQRNGEYSTGY